MLQILSVHIKKTFAAALVLLLLPAVMIKTVQAEELTTKIACEPGDHTAPFSNIFDTNRFAGLPSGLPCKQPDLLITGYSGGIKPGSFGSVTFPGSPARARPAADDLRLSTYHPPVRLKLMPTNSGSAGLQNQRTISPRRALLQSFVVPGWGHYYTDRNDWTRGQYHLGAEVALISAFLIFHTQAGIFERNMFTYAASHSGTDLRDRDREFQLAVGSYNSLAEYNDYQERTRHWNRIYPDTPEYQWEWTSEDNRIEYRQLRNNRDRANQQLPALISMMVINRIISGVNAFTRARDLNTPEVNVSFHPDSGPGIHAHLRFRL